MLCVIVLGSSGTFFHIILFVTDLTGEVLQKGQVRSV